MRCTRCQVILATCWISIASALTCNVFVFGHAAAEPKQDPALSEKRPPLDERMMNILTDPKTSFDAKREAAGNLAALNREDDPNSPGIREYANWLCPTEDGYAPCTAKAPAENPAVKKFN